MSLFDQIAGLGRQYNKTVTILTDTPMWSARLKHNNEIYSFRDFEDAYKFAVLWNGPPEEGNPLTLQYTPKSKV